MGKFKHQLGIRDEGMLDGPKREQHAPSFFSILKDAWKHTREEIDRDYEFSGEVKGLARWFAPMVRKTPSEERVDSYTDPVTGNGVLRGVTRRRQRPTPPLLIKGALLIL